MYDITSQASFTNLSRWLEDIEEVRTFKERGERVCFEYNNNRLLFDIDSAG